MKKLSILLFAVMIAGSFSAQIDSFSDEDVFISKPTKPTFSKKGCLQPYPGNLSPCGRSVYDIIGEQLFCKSQAIINSTQKKYVLVREDNSIVLSNLQQGEYYIVKNILITKEEKDSLQTVINNMPFTSDTLYYCDVNNTIAQLLDKSQPLPKKAKQYIIPKEDILKVFYNQYREWPTEENLIGSKDINVAIFILTDKAGKEYYVPMEDQRYENVFKLDIVKPAWPNPISFYPGMLAGISDFIMVKGVKNIKNIFENQRITQPNANGNELFCKKIALKGEKIVAAITDTLSTSITYYPVYNLLREPIGWDHKEDTLFFIGLVYESPEGNGYMTFCRKHDLDSVNTKLAYERHMEEQEKIRKDEQKRHELVKKYGQKIGQSIAEGKACVGMTKEQCKEAMGTPDETTKNTSNLGVIEVWTYSLGYRMFDGLVPITVVTFLDDKVTSVDEYTSWPF